MLSNSESTSAPGLIQGPQRKASFPLNISSVRTQRAENNELKARWQLFCHAEVQSSQFRFWFLGKYNGSAAMAVQDCRKTRLFVTPSRRTKRGGSYGLAPPLCQRLAGGLSVSGRICAWTSVLRGNSQFSPQRSSEAVFCNSFVQKAVENEGC
jgi:hypothetical protein